MKRAFSLALATVLLVFSIAFGEEVGYTTYNYKGVSFEYNSSYSIEEKDAGLTILFSQSNSRVNIISADFTGLADFFLLMSISGYTQNLDVQGLEEDDLDLGDFPARCAIGHIKSGDSWIPLMVASLLSDESVYTLAYFGDPTLDASSSEDHAQDFVHLLESIKPIPLSEERKAELGEAHLEKLEEFFSVQKIVTSKPSKKGAVTLTISWTNKSEDAVKEVSFYVTPLNADGEPVGGEKDGESTICLKHSKSVKAGKKADSKFKDAWTNSDIASVRLDKVEITYDDLYDSMETINGSYFDYQWVK